jgi:outer membrane protein
MSVALLLSVPVAAAEEMKTAVVDMRRALGETDEGRKATSDIKRLFDAKQKQLSEREAELKRASDDLEKKRTLLAAEAVRQKEAELQQKAEALRQTFERDQEELSRKQAELLDSLYPRLQRIVSAIASTENLSLVLDRSQLNMVVFVRPHLDITNEVIRRFNAEGRRSDRH